MRDLSLLAVALAAGGCAVAPAPSRPDIASFAPAAFADAGATSAAAQWWRVLGDDALTELVDEALAHNRDLRAAEANVRAARAALGERRFDLAPTVTAEGSFARRRTSASGLGATIPGFAADEPFPTTDLFDAGLAASWELDFWGRVRKSVSAARADAAAAAADRDNARVIVAADAASAYVSLRGAQARLDVAERNAAVQKDQLDLTRALVEAGRASELDLARAAALLESTLATIPPLEAAEAAQRRRLAVLTGAREDDLAERLGGRRALPSPPDGTPAGDPALVLRQRPDVRAAELAFSAAADRVGVAAADLFPRVSFVGSFGASSSNLAAFGTAPSIDYGFGPTITWAAFDMGRVRARIRQAGFEAEAAAARYEQTALLALEETANAFTDYAREQARSARLQAAVAANADAARLADVRYRSGLSDFLVVLDAQRSLLDAEDRAAASRTEALLDLIAVYRALGGGWRMENAEIALAE